MPRRKGETEQEYRARLRQQAKARASRREPGTADAARAIGPPSSATLKEWAADQQAQIRAEGPITSVAPRAVTEQDLAAAMKAATVAGQSLPSIEAFCKCDHGSTWHGATRRTACRYPGCSCGFFDHDVDRDPPPLATG